jgi:hypothetical protein
MYALHTNDVGEITALDRLVPPDTDWGSAVRVPLDENDAHQAFRAANPSLNLTKLPSGALVCLGVEPLVAWCKHAGIMLYAEFDEGRGARRFKTDGIHDAGVRLNCLCRARAFDPSSGGPEPASGIIGRESYIWVTDRVLNDLNAVLPDETQEIRRISSWPIERTFVYVDVSDFSQSKPGQQALIINSLVYIVA